MIDNNIHGLVTTKMPEDKKQVLRLKEPSLGLMFGAVEGPDRLSRDQAGAIIDLFDDLEDEDGNGKWKKQIQRKEMKAVGIPNVKSRFKHSTTYRRHDVLLYPLLSSPLLSWPTHLRWSAIHRR